MSANCKHNTSGLVSICDNRAMLALPDACWKATAKLCATAQDLKFLAHVQFSKNHAPVLTGMLRAARALGNLKPPQTLRQLSLTIALTHHTKYALHLT